MLSLIPFALDQNQSCTPHVLVLDAPPPLSVLGVREEADHRETADREVIVKAGIGARRGSWSQEARGLLIALTLPQRRSEEGPASPQ